MALKTTTVKLTAPVMAFGKRYSEIVLREPSAALYLATGPLAVSYKSGDTESTHDLPGVAETYLGRCCTNVEDAEIAMQVILLELSLEDGLALRRALNGFFNDAAERLLAKVAPAAPVPVQAQAAA